MAKVLRADDKRRNYHKADVGAGSTGSGKRAGSLFNDRRKSHANNGKGKRAK